MSVAKLRSSHLLHFIVFILAVAGCSSSSLGRLLQGAKVLIIHLTFVCDRGDVKIVNPIIMKAHFNKHPVNRECVR